MKTLEKFRKSDRSEILKSSRQGKMNKDRMVIEADESCFIHMCKWRESSLCVQRSLWEQDEKEAKIRMNERMGEGINQFGQLFGNPVHVKKFSK